MKFFIDSPTLANHKHLQIRSSVDLHMKKIYCNLNRSVFYITPYPLDIRKGPLIRWHT